LVVAQDDVFGEGGSAEGEILEFFEFGHGGKIIKRGDSFFYL
jgi:hypothetical protein